MENILQKILLGSLLCLCPLSLSACGPKTVGDDIESAPLHGNVSPAHDPANLRYPLTGRAIDKALYIVNSPAYMQARQKNLERYLHDTYMQDNAPNDYTNLQPRQVSPFRQ